MAAVALVVIVAGSILWLTRPGGDREPEVAARAPRPSQSAQRPATASHPRSCGIASRAFRPQTITVPGVTRPASVVTPARDADGVPGVAPLTAAGKAVFAWDREQGVRPGDHAGNVLLNAHTWPDGSALGNHLLTNLHRGDRIVVHGTKARLCYRVTQRVEMLASRGMARYYAKYGPPQLAIVVCSGRRLRPGVWEKRTVWFASPST